VFAKYSKAEYGGWWHVSLAIKLIWHLTGYFWKLIFIPAIKFPEELCKYEKLLLEVYEQVLHKTETINWSLQGI